MEDTEGIEKGGRVMKAGHHDEKSVIRERSRCIPIPADQTPFF